MKADRGTTNVRKLNFQHWKRWFGVENRCLVPVTSFAEPDRSGQPAEKTVARCPMLGLLATRKSLMFFAGIHVPQWQSVRKVKDGLTIDDLYGFLTTDPKELCKPIHEKTMQVLLLTEEEIDTWMRAPWEEAKDAFRERDIQ